MLTYAVINQSLLQNQEYTEMMSIILGTLVLHGGFVVGKATSK